MMIFSSTRFIEVNFLMVFINLFMKHGIDIKMPIPIIYMMKRVYHIIIK